MVCNWSLRPGQIWRSQRSQWHETQTSQQAFIQDLDWDGMGELFVWCMLGWIIKYYRSQREKRNQCFRQGLLVIKVLYIRFWPRNRNAGIKILQITTRQKETWRHVSLWWNVEANIYIKHRKLLSLFLAYSQSNLLFWQKSWFTQF